jgi:hypothetical protein
VVAQIEDGFEGAVADAAGRSSFHSKFALYA